MRILGLVLVLVIALGAAAQSSGMEEIQELAMRVQASKERLADLDYNQLEQRISQLSLRVEAGETQGLAQELEDLSYLLLESRSVETRAIWIDDITLKRLRTPEDVAQLVEWLASMNFNVLLPDVYGRGESIFPSQVVPQEERFMFMFRGDMLQMIIDEAHKWGMEVHALVCVFGLDYKVVHFVEKVDWLERDRNGRYADVQWGQYFLSPAVPAVREYLIAMIRELAQYPLDGIHLDYIRYQYGFGFGDYSRSLYQSLTGRDPVDLSPDDLDFRLFKSQFVSSFVERATKEALEVNPNLLISAAVAAPRAHAKNNLSQDWEHWARNRSLHYIFHMTYVYTAEEYKPLLESEIGALSGRIQSFPGTGLYNYDEMELVRQWETGRLLPTTGQAAFSTIHLNQAMEDALKKGIFRNQATPTLGEPARAAMEQILNLKQRLQSWGPETGMPQSLWTELAAGLGRAYDELSQLSLRPWRGRNLREGSPQELEGLESVVGLLERLRDTARTSPTPGAQRVQVEIAQILSLLTPLLYSSTPFVYSPLTP